MTPWPLWWESCGGPVEHSVAGPCERWPRYLLVGALRGWGDIDADGHTTVREAARWADDMRHVVLGTDAPKIQAAGQVNIRVSDRVEPAPSAARFRRLD
ncbi:MAG: hypothetical protein ACI8PZ_005472 [Myxococcota bacterium]